MRVFPVKSPLSEYAANAYLLLGEENRPEDVNTLIDAGSDATLVRQIDTFSTGIGKKRVEIVLLTHNHFDHVGGARAIRDAYGSRIYGFDPAPPVDQPLYNGQWIEAADTQIQVLHTPGHSPDSVCFFAPREEILFSGDLEIDVKSVGGVYSAQSVTSLKRILDLNPSVIYPGHGDPIRDQVRSMLETTLRNMRRSEIRESD